MYRFNRMGNFWTNILKKKINYRHNEVKKKTPKNIEPENTQRFRKTSQYIFIVKIILKS